MDKKEEHEIKKSIGEKIKNRRKGKKLTQTELASLLKTRKQHVSEWERGKKMPDGNYLVKLSRILGKIL